MIDDADALLNGQSNIVNNNTIVNNNGLLFGVAIVSMDDNDQYSIAHALVLIIASWKLIYINYNS